MATQVNVGRDGSIDIDFTQRRPQAGFDPAQSYSLQPTGGAPAGNAAGSQFPGYQSYAPQANFGQTNAEGPSSTAGPGAPPIGSTPRPAAAASKNTAITDLIDDLKKGKITKAELFEQLAKFKASKAAQNPVGNSNVSNNDDRRPADGPALQSRDFGARNLQTPEQRQRAHGITPQAHPSAAFQQPPYAANNDRYRSVNDHASSMINNAAANSLAKFSQPASPLRQVSFAERAPGQAPAGGPHGYGAHMQPPHGANSFVPEDVRSSRQNATGRSIQKATAQAAEHWDRNRASGRGAGPHALSGSRNSVRKPRRSSSTQKARSQLVDVVGSQAECTFQPQVRDLPETYEGASLLKSYQKVDFTERVLLWQQQKKQELQRRKEAIMDETMANCTFQPRINENSEHALYRQNRSKPIEERLYYDTTDSHARRRERLLAEARAKAQKELERTCPFKPKISKKSERYARQRTLRSASAGRASSRMRRQQLQAINGDGPADDENATKFTFKPKTNKVKRSMVSAKNYLSQNWVDRLSKPHPSQLGQGNDDDDSYQSDSGGDKENNFDHRASGGRISSTPLPYTRKTKRKSHRPSSAPPPRRRGDSTPMSNEEKRASFKNFIQKQKTRSEQQKKRLEKSRINNTPSFQPKITKRAQNHKQPRKFLERVKMHSDHWRRTRSEAGRDERLGQLMKNVASTGNFASGQAFQPWLTKKSKSTRARSWAEMSTGDQRRREERRRMMKLQATKKLMKEATFEPKIATKNSKLAPSTDGHLRILSDPESYVDRVRSRTHAMNTKTRRVQQHADLKEYAECTFHPQTKKVPKYITRISQTMKMAKELRKQQGLDDSAKKPERPEWR